MNKVFCEECDWQGMEHEVLIGKNPFDVSDTILGCPKCKTIDKLYPACFADNCWFPVTCGVPTVGGYMKTCGKHRPNV
jgi:hypothetical protein